MNLGLKGKTALVTGGAQGIGEAIARALVEEGCDVTFTTRHFSNVARLGKVILTDLEEWSGKSVDYDILVNNAGSTLDIKDPYCSTEKVRRVMRLNYEIPREMSLRVLPYMKKKGWGRIVNIGSISGIENRGPVTFCAAKAALLAFTKGMGRILAQESPGVVMSAVLPGIVMTEGGHWAKASEEHKARYLDREAALKRFGRPEEIAPQVVLQCSELASFYHGCINSVDAGLYKGF
jgi:NAD(P)-dependent dehydrogenase (short-subunit alcohol dehydrogenase family)